MSRFRYRMQNILNIKTSLESQAKMHYAEANAKLREQEEKLSAMVRRKEAYEDRARELRKETLKIQEINEVARAIMYVEEEIKLQEREVSYARRNVQKAKEIMTQAMQERKTQEKLREKAFEEFLLDEKARESKEIDELTSYTYGQKIVGEN